MPFETKKLVTIEEPLMRPNRLVLASFRSNGDHFLASTFLQVLLDVFNELCECCQSGNFGLKIGFSTQALQTWTASKYFEYFTGCFLFYIAWPTLMEKSPFFSSIKVIP